MKFKSSEEPSLKAPTTTPAKTKSRFDPRRNLYDRLFIFLFIVALVLRVVWLDQPPGSLIFDEKYYVNVARIIAGYPHDADTYADAKLGLDPNLEHPPLAKLLIAASILVFGNNAYGWRLPSVVFGMASLLLFYLLIKRVSGSGPIALVSSVLFSFDNLVFVHSRIATLDIFTLGFMLLGFYLYFGGRTRLSAAALGLSTLTKIGGFYGFLVIVAVELFTKLRAQGKPTISKASVWEFLSKPVQVSLIRMEQTFSPNIGATGNGIAGEPPADSEQPLVSFLKWLEKYAVVYVAVGILGLALMDQFWVATPNFWEHVQYIYRYTFSLTRPCPSAIESCPWQWLINQVEIPYLSVSVNVIADGKVTQTFTKMLFLGAMNPAILFLALPAMAYEVYLYTKGMAGQFSLFVVAWFAITYLPFYPMSLFAHRIMYIHYFLDTMPAVCAAIGHASIQARIPRIYVFGYLGLVLYFFAMMFPFKGAP